MIEELRLLRRVAVFLDGLRGGPIVTRLYNEYEWLRAATAPYLPKETTMSPDYTSATREYLDAVSRAVYEVEEAKIEEIAAMICEGAEDARLLLVAGNGGSHCTALHLATDLEKCIVDALPPENRGPSVTPRVRVLGENPGIWSAWANDNYWETALAHQVVAWGSPNALLLLLSASGESKNLVRALEAAHGRKMQVIALVGRHGSTLEQMADVALVVGTDDVQVAEDVHSTCCHAIFREVLRRIKERCGVKG